MVGWGVCMLLVLAGAEMEERREVILCTDLGASIDDQFALMHLAVSPGIVLRGVVTSHAPNLEPPAAEMGTRQAREVLGLVSAERRPRVLAGASRALEAEDRPNRNEGVDFLLEMARSHGPADRLAVALTGPATDVASALLIDPTWADRVEVVAMAFDGWPGGGDVWNVKHDPTAWRVLLASRVPLVVGDDAVSRPALTMTVEMARKRFGASGPAGRFLIKLVERQLAANPDMARELTGSERAWPLWDEVVVAYLANWTRQEIRERPVLREDLGFAKGGQGGKVVWITGVEGDRVWEDLAALARVEAIEKGRPDSRRRACPGEVSG